jgi:hypothetical protein
MELKIGGVYFYDDKDLNEKYFYKIISIDTFEMSQTTLADPITWESVNYRVAGVKGRLDTAGVYWLSKNSVEASSKLMELLYF